MRISTAGAAIGAVALFGLGFTSSPAGAQVVQKANGYLMRINWVKGKVYKFNVSIERTGAGASGGAMQTPITMSVADVKNGVATLNVSMKPMTVGSQSTKAQNNQVKVDSRGKTVGSSNSMSLLVGLPEKPIKVGGSWTDSFKTQAGMGVAMNVTAKYTLKSIKQVGPRKVAEIATSNTGNGGGMAAAGTGVYTIDLADGMLVSGSMKQSVTITTSVGENGKPQKMTIPTTVNLKRI